MADPNSTILLDLLHHGSQEFSAGARDLWWLAAGRAIETSGIAEIIKVRIGDETRHAS